MVIVAEEMGGREGVGESGTEVVGGERTGRDRVLRVLRVSRVEGVAGRYRFDGGVLSGLGVC